MNRSCQATKETYAPSSYQAGGGGAFFKVIARNPGPNWSEPDSNLLDDMVAFEDPQTQQVPVVGVSQVPFAFNYKEGLSVEDSYKYVARFATQGAYQVDLQFRSYGFIKIPEDGVYSFMLKANRSTTNPDPACKYCAISGTTHVDACTSDNSNEVIGSRRCDRSGYCWYENSCCQNCFTQGYCDISGDYLGYCSQGCTPDCRGNLKAWLAVEGTGDNNAPLTPAAYNPDQSLETNYAGYVNKWKQIGFFSHNEVDPDNPDDGNFWAGDNNFAASYYPFEISGDWDELYPIYNPELWWRRLTTSGWSNWTIYDDGQEGAQLYSCGLPSSCNISLSAPSGMDPGETVPMAVADGSNNVDQVEVTSSDPAVLSVSPSFDSTPDDGFNFTLESSGNVQNPTEVTNTATGTDLASGASCTANQQVSVSNQKAPWWQVEGGDVWDHRLV